MVVVVVVVSPAEVVAVVVAEVVVVVVVVVVVGAPMSIPHLFVVVVVWEENAGGSHDPDALQPLSMRGLGGPCGFPLKALHCS